MLTILFICTGNTCRSPLAEAVARYCAEQGQLCSPAEALFFCSAGVAAGEGAPPSIEAQVVLSARKIPHEGLSKPLTGEMIQNAHLVLAMTRSHLEVAATLIDHDPAHISKIHALNMAGDIPDPIGCGQEVYDSLVDQFLELIPARLNELLEEDPACST